MKRIGVFSFAAICSVALAGNGYPPCSATVADRCIQLYEPGVATRTNLALNEQLGPDRTGVGLAAMGGPYEPVEVEEDYAVWDDQAPEPEDWTAEDDEYAPTSRLTRTIPTRTIITPRTIITTACSRGTGAAQGCAGVSSRPYHSSSRISWSNSAYGA